MTIPTDLDEHFGAEPELLSPNVPLRAGKAALLRRRVGLAACGTAAAVVVTGLALTWTSNGGSADQSAVAGDPSQSATAAAPTARTQPDPDDIRLVPYTHCRYRVCVDGPELAGNATILGYLKGELVRYRTDFDIVDIVEDPSNVGAARSALLEVSVDGKAYRIAMADAFGYKIVPISDGDDDTLEEWYADQHGLPKAASCGVLGPEPETPGYKPGFPPIPEPGECFLEVDDQGDVSGAQGVTITRRVTDQTASPRPFPPGVEASAYEFERNGMRWYGHLIILGKGDWVNAVLEPARGNGTLEKWVKKWGSDHGLTGSYGDYP